ncbi:MAG: FlgD immunoglobulin-like domain containing protein [Chthoniobacterales bacterium]
MRLAILFCSILALASLQAQETPTPTLSPPPTTSPTPSATPARSVSLRFALPPLEGTISLGIFDQTGKLVRVLHREDTVSDFTTGHDALETTWDGTDDAGKSLPNGKYRAHGYVVGDLKVEGIGYFFNDWVTDENSPHILRLLQLWMKDGELLVDAELSGGRKTTFICDRASGAIRSETTALTGEHCLQLAALPNVVDCAEGKDGTVWVVDSDQPGGLRQVKQVGRNHEVLRRLDYVADDPQPQRIEASRTGEEIFLLERNDLLERLRGLALVRTITNDAEGAVSDWKDLFDRKIIAHQNFALENKRPVAVSATTPAQPTKIAQKLRPDPLQHDAPGKVELAVGFDADGSYLETATGLPLRTISDTPGLSRTLLARQSDDALDVFQDDGAVVEQFQVSNLAEMIAFDCGDFELK